MASLWQALEAGTGLYLLEFEGNSDLIDTSVTVKETAIRLIEGEVSSRLRDRKAVPEPSKGTGYVVKIRQVDGRKLLLALTKMVRSGSRNMGFTTAEICCNCPAEETRLSDFSGAFGHVDRSYAYVLASAKQGNRESEQRLEFLYPKLTRDQLALAMRSVGTCAGTANTERSRVDDPAKGSEHSAAHW